MVHRAPDPVRGSLLPNMVQEHARRKKERGGVGDALARDAGANPGIASNIAQLSPTLPDGAKPRPPTRSAMKSERMSPNMFSMTRTSNR
jgi:hypothetical protein